ARLCPFIYLDSGAETNLITEDFVEVYSKERRDSFGYHKLKKNFSTRFLGMFDKDKPGIAPSAVLLRVPVRLGTMSKREWILTFFVVKQLPFKIMIGFNDWRQMVANLDLVHNKLIMRDSQPATHVPYHEELGANATTDLGREMEPDEEFQEVEEQIDISEPSQAPHEDRHYPREPRPSTNSSSSSSRASASSSSALLLHSEVPSTSSSSSSAALPLYSVIPPSSSSSSSSSSSKPSIKPIPRKKPRFKTIKRVHFVTDTSDK